MDPIRVFIGTESKTAIMEQVLRHSILQHTTQPVEFTSMDGPGWEMPGDLPRGTGFSLRRWMIPEKCGFKGRAIYVDADILCLADLRPLWEWSLPADCSCGMTYQPDKFRKEPWPQSSVMIIDCEAAGKQWNTAVLWGKLRRQAIPYPEFMHGTWLNPQPAQLPTAWNHLNVFQDGITRLLHYTREPDQPPYRPEHPLAHLWKAALRSAIQAGAVNQKDFTSALHRWKVKEDWRPTNGLHPVYAGFLKYFPATA